MTDQTIRDLVIVGGGTAGWMMAAAAALALGGGKRRITLIESEAIGTVGVGEATIPPILSFNARLGIDEGDFLRETRGSYKLGIEFVGWRNGHDRYFHPFGTTGREFEGVPFHQIWLGLRHLPGIGPLDDYSMCAAAAEGDRFAAPGNDPRSPLSTLGYAYHFDASLYAAFLRRRAEAGGVTRIEGRIAAVDRDPDSGHVTALRLDGDRSVAGDLFIDCTGFRSLLLGEALDVPFVDWSHWLPCDRAVALPSAPAATLSPYTRATAHSAGWQWRIPLQHRTGNGRVYPSAFIDDDTAIAELLAGLDTPPAGEPRVLRFQTGVRDRLWEGNVVALGLAGGFLEPLESTSIHLIQTGISKLLALFPDQNFDPVERAEYNRLMRAQYEAVRDFVIAHYCITEREDTPFWHHCRGMELPHSLERRLALFRGKGRIFRYDDELFTAASWAAVLIGQGLTPRGTDPLLDALDPERLAAALRSMRQTHLAITPRLPRHAEALRAAMTR